MANFSDARCTAGGVCPSDPLIFTCEVNDTFGLRVTLPTGKREIISIGDTTDHVALPAGFTADSLVIITLNNYTSRNFSLTLSIENASLLNGGQISCDDITQNMAKAGCPLAGEPSV